MSRTESSLNVRSTFILYMFVHDVSIIVVVIIVVDYK